MTKPTTYIGKRALLLAGVLSLVVGLSQLRAQEPGVTFAGGNFDLKVDSEASYNGVPVPAGTWSLKDLVPGVDKFFNFNDIKPGDQGENTISLHAKKSPLWVCLTFYNLLNGENDINEPESHVDATPAVGELTSAMEFFAWQDDGDNIFEVGEKPLFGTSTQAANQVLNGKTYPVYDYSTGGAIPKNGTKHVGVYWCAGDLTVDVPTATINCEGQSLGNEYQTDTMKVDVRLTAVSATEQPKFQCGNVKPPKPPKPPKGEICEDDVTITIINNNNATVTNTTTSSSNTGGNTATGGSGASGGSATVVTGNASSNAQTINVVNTNFINIFSSFLKKK